MGTIEPIMKRFFIMDTSENYYRLDKSGQLVAADSREDAVFFTYEEADKKIGKGKRAHYYKIVPTEMHPEGTIPSQLSQTGEQPGPDSNIIPVNNKFDAPELSDFSEIDWLVYLQNFSYIVTNIRDYKERLCEAESRQDQAIIDLLHFIEFYDLDEIQTQEILFKVKTAREYRRDIKNELYRIGQFISSIGTNNNACLVNTAIKAIRRYETCKYKPRVLPELFQDAPEETHRMVSCFHEMAARYNESCDCDDNAEYEEEGENMERKDTIYDTAKPNWDSFVKWQADFFRYARQHVRNLQIDLERIDVRIENTLAECEDARYNVAQGYTVFKTLKDLRNKRKAVVMELQKVTAITDRFDCDIMRDIYEEIESEYDEILPDPDEASASSGDLPVSKAV